MRVFLNLLILTFVCGIAGLGIRSAITDDHRFGWAMFSTQIDYRIQYRLHYDDHYRIHHTGYELRGKSRSKLSDRRTHITRYGIGALRSWLASYTCYLYESDRTGKIEYVEAVVHYYINRKKSDIKTITCPKSNHW